MVKNDWCGEIQTTGGQREEKNPMYGNRGSVPVRKKMPGTWVVQRGGVMLNGRNKSMVWFVSRQVSGGTGREGTEALEPSLRSPGVQRERDSNVNVKEGEELRAKGTVGWTWGRKIECKKQVRWKENLSGEIDGNRRRLGEERTVRRGCGRVWWKGGNSKKITCKTAPRRKIGGTQKAVKKVRKRICAPAKV